MKTSTVVALGIGGLALFLLLKPRIVGGYVSSTTPRPNPNTTAPGTSNRAQLESAATQVGIKAGTELVNAGVGAIMSYFGGGSSAGDERAPIASYGEWF